MIPINRDWLTLAFGVGLVTVVVGLSVRHNVQWRATQAAEPGADAAAPAAQPAAAVADAVAREASAAQPAAGQPIPPAPGGVAAASRSEASPAPANALRARFDVSVPVVHKHRFGSCQGTLRATEEGLLFGASDKGDTFQLSFRDIDRFDVAGGTLTVRRRGGRTWNFNGQDDKLDGLLAFHRAVERARK